MEFLSPQRMMVEMQKAVTLSHRLLLQSPLGPYLNRFLPGPDFLVLHTTGRKSGQPRQTPLSFTRDGTGEQAAYVVIASNGGAPRHPDWYQNLQARPDADAEVEVDGRRIPVRAETTEGTERDRLFEAAVRSYAGYRGYQARTQREIPVVRLIPR
jgi:deazaflavin-dependent oxidoreductase (nitroreductase family)